MKTLACGVLAAAGLLVGSSVAAQPKAASAGFTCSGKEEVLFDNTNASLVDAGGTPPSFSTNGFTYCLTYIEHYHWNNGKGGAPGKIGLKGPTTVTFQALGSSGQGGAKNVNHYVYVPKDPQVLIKGTYSCTDTAAATWASNKKSGGHGFCVVKGEIAIPPITIPGVSTTATTTEEPLGYDLSVTAAPVSSVGEWAKDGSRLTFDTTITVANAPDEGSSPATTMKLIVGASANVLRTRLHVKGPDGACAPASCPVPALKPGKKAVYVLSIERATPALKGKVTLDLDVDCDQDEERSCSNNIFPRAADGKGVTLTVQPRSTTVSTTPLVLPSADLDVSITFKEHPRSKKIGLDVHHVGWTITIENNGPADARGVVVSVTAPAQDGGQWGMLPDPHKHWTFIAIGKDNDDDECDERGTREWVCSYPIIKKGDHEVITLGGFPKVNGQFVLHVKAHAATHDPKPANNTAIDSQTLK